MLTIVPVYTHASRLASRILTIPLAIINLWCLWLPSKCHPDWVYYSRLMINRAFRQNELFLQTGMVMEPNVQSGIGVVFSKSWIPLGGTPSWLFRDVLDYMRIASVSDSQDPCVSIRDLWVILRDVSVAIAWSLSRRSLSVNEENSKTV